MLEICGQSSGMTAPPGTAGSMVPGAPSGGTFGGMAAGTNLQSALNGLFTAQAGGYPLSGVAHHAEPNVPVAAHQAMFCPPGVGPMSRPGAGWP